MAKENRPRDALDHVVRGPTRYEVLEKRDRLNGEFWCAVTRAHRYRRRIQAMQTSDDKPAASRTLVTMLRELTSLSSRKIALSRDRAFPLEEVTHCSLPSIKDEMADYIRLLEEELDQLRTFSAGLSDLDYEMRDHRLNDWHKFPAPRTAEEEAADQAGINRVRYERSTGKRGRH